MQNGPSWLSAVRSRPSISFAVLRRGDRHAGHREHVRDVVEAHVGLAVLAHESRAVHAEDDRQVLDRDVVDDVVVGALQERGVDGADRPDALRREPGGERHRVALGDADVEEPLGILLREDAGAGAPGHRRGDRHQSGCSSPSAVRPSPNTWV